MLRFALFALLKLLAILIAVFFVAGVLTLDLILVHQVEFIAGAGVWLAILGLVYKVEDDVMRHLEIRTVRMG